MHPSQIVVADYLDILFENRNKDYGAYALRRDYNVRLARALMITAGILIGVLTAYYIRSNQIITDTPTKPDVIVTLIDPKLDEAEPTPPPPPPPPPPAPQIATVRNFIPIIVNEDVSPEDAPPDVDELDGAKIGNITQPGQEYTGITEPPIRDDRGVIAAPSRDDNDEKIWMKVEIESSFPGGPNAWKRYLMKTLTYPEFAEENRIQGAVAVRFVVDLNGKVSDVQALSGPIELREEAVRVITKSGKWNPAVQNGTTVKSYKHQVIIFQVDSQ